MEEVLKEREEVFSLPEIDDDLLEDWSQNDFSELLNKKLKDPNYFLDLDQKTDLMFECINYGRIEAKKIRNKDIVLVLGSIDAGKSTTINYLKGRPLEEVPEEEWKNIGFSYTGAAIPIRLQNFKEAETFFGPIGSSDTFIPVPVACGDKANGWVYVDCPGFFDNRCQEINIANMTNIKNFLMQARSVRLLFLLDRASFEAQRCEGVRDLIKMLNLLFNQKVEEIIVNKDSILVGITKIKPDPKIRVNSFLNILKEMSFCMNDDEEKQRAEKIRDIFTDNFDQNQPETQKIILFDPLDRVETWMKKESLLMGIKNLKKIENPKKMFSSSALNEKDIAFLKEIVGNLIQRIIKIVKEAENRFLNNEQKKKILNEVKKYFSLKVLENNLIDQMKVEIKDAMDAFNKSLIYPYIKIYHQVSKEKAEEIIKEIKYFKATYKNLVSIDSELINVLQKSRQKQDALESELKQLEELKNKVKTLEEKEKMNQNYRTCFQESIRQGFPDALSKGDLNLVKAFVEYRGIDVRKKMDLTWINEHIRTFSATLERETLREKVWKGALIPFLGPVVSFISLGNLLCQSECYIYPADMAIRVGSLEILKYFIEELQININEKYDNKVIEAGTLLHIAAYNEKLDILKYLIEKGISKNERDKKNGYTALHIAAEKGNIEIVRFLVDDAKCKYPNQKDCPTPLKLARKNGRKKVAEYLEVKYPGENEDRCHIF